MILKCEDEVQSRRLYLQACKWSRIDIQNIWRILSVLRKSNQPNGVMGKGYQQAFHVSGKWSESCSVMSDCLQPHGLYRPWNSPGQNTGLDSCLLFQGIFATQGLIPGLLHCRQTFFLPAEPPGKPKNTGVVALKQLRSSSSSSSLFLLQWIFPTQELDWSLLHCRWILYQLSYQGILHVKHIPKGQQTLEYAPGKWKLK